MLYIQVCSTASSSRPCPTCTHNLLADSLATAEEGRPLSQLDSHLPVK